MTKTLNVYKGEELLGSDPTLVHVALDDGDYPAGTFKGSFTEDGKESDKVDFPAVTIKKIIAATGIKASQATASIKIGATKTITVTADPANATDGADVVKATTWKSSDDTIATVGADGTITAVKDGTATVTATSGAFIATVAVTVQEADPASSTAS